MSLRHAGLSAALVAAVFAVAATAASSSEQTPVLGADAGRYLYVPNRASADVAVIDTMTDEVVAKVPVGTQPHQVVISDALGKLVASNTADDSITIFDLRRFQVEATLTLDNEPEHMELSPGGSVLVVGNIGAGTLSLISLSENRELARIEGLFEPHNLTFGPEGDYVFVANLGANHVSVVSLAEGKVVKEIPVAEPTPLAAAAADEASAEYQGIINVTRTPDGRLGFAAHGEGNTMAVLDLRTKKTIKQLALGELPWRAFSTADGRYMLVPNNGDRTVSVISTATLEVVATLPGAADMTGINTGWFETTAFVISRGDDKAVILDLETLQPAGEIALPGTPETGVTTPDGRKLYVALSEADKVAVIDIRARKVIKLIDGVGEEPWGATMVGAINYCH